MLVFLAALGCGGAAAGDGGLDLIDFGDDPPPSSESLESADFALTLNPEVLVEVRFLYGHQVRLESMRRLNRDLQSLLEYSGPAEVDLEWVIEVHEVTARADELFQRLTSRRMPVSQREQYRYLFLNMLDAIQVMGYGADRVLAASIRVGPGGRTLLTMSGAESAEFHTLVREAAFYLDDAGRLVESQLSSVGNIISGLRLR